MRTIDWFRWTTVIAVVLAIAMPAVVQQHGSRYLALSSILAIWILVFGGIYFAFRWLAKGRNDWWAIYGMCAGVVCGIVAGLTSDLGYELSTLLQPKEPPHFTASKFGLIFGAIFGSFVGALIGGIAGIVARRLQPVKPVL